ncbi:MAG: (4Fe-4S)-binding protein [Gemmatimonadaceae bacterium]
MSEPASQMGASGADGGAAPPPPDATNKAPADRTRAYRAGGITVEWYASRCIHSAACIRAQPAVFDPRRRPWVDVDAADAAGADAVADAVLRCPTGALHYVRHDGGAPEPEGVAVELRAVPGGPYYVRGSVEVRSDDGALIRRDTRMALCRCGRTQHAPFCDNSHRAREA